MSTGMTVAATVWQMIRCMLTKAKWIVATYVLFTAERSDSHLYLYAVRASIANTAWWYAIRLALATCRLTARYVLSGWSSCTTDCLTEATHLVSALQPLALPEAPFPVHCWRAAGVTLPALAAEAAAAAAVEDGSLLGGTGMPHVLPEVDATPGELPSLCLFCGEPCEVGGCVGG
jgi:hypothetical protein